MTLGGGAAAANVRKKRASLQRRASQRASLIASTRSQAQAQAQAQPQAQPQALAQAQAPSEAVGQTAVNAATVSHRGADDVGKEEAPQDREGLAAVADGDGGSVSSDPSLVGSDDGSCRRLIRRADRARVLIGRFVNNERVQLVVVALIAINAIMMGIGTFDFVMDDPVVEARFETVDQVFLILFTVELAMQFVYHGFRLFMDGWLLFDFVVIVASWAFSGAQIIRAFRIFRALRLITRIEVMRNLVSALFSVMPRMAAIGLLLFLIMYIFAVMFTQLFKYMYHEDQTEYDYFSRLEGTFFTLFQIMTLDAWADVARDVMGTYPWAWLPFIVFVIISGFIVVNLIIAVICDAIAALHEEDRAKLHGLAMEDEEGMEGGDESHSSVGGSGVGAGGEGAALSPEEKQREIEALEGQIEELTKIQEQTMKTLQFLTQQLKSSEQARALREKE